MWSNSVDLTFICSVAVINDSEIWLIDKSGEPISILKKLTVFMKSVLALNLINKRNIIM